MRVSAIREVGGQALVAYAYNAKGERASITRGNGAVSTYGYDGASPLVSLTEDMPGARPRHDLVTPPILSTNMDQIRSIAYRFASQDQKICAQVNSRFAGG